MKRLFKSYVECEAAYKTERDNANTSRYALSELANGEIKWIRKGDYSAGVGPVSEVTGVACLIVKFAPKGQKPMSAAFSDAFYYMGEEMRILGSFGHRDKDQRDRFDLACAVRKNILDQEREIQEKRRQATQAV